MKTSSKVMVYVLELKKVWFQSFSQRTNVAAVWDADK